MPSRIFGHILSQWGEFAGRGGPKKALRYFSDGFPVYRDLLYPGKAKHEVVSGKSGTSSVEAHNAELRHSLARLARKSRCFSRCAEALH